MLGVTKTIFFHLKIVVVLQIQLCQSLNYYKIQRQQKQLQQFLLKAFPYCFEKLKILFLSGLRLKNKWRQSLTKTKTIKWALSSYPYALSSYTGTVPSCSQELQNTTHISHSTAQF